MPLPDIQTQDTAAAIQANQHPAFMTDPITSPNTTVGVPVPAIAAPQPQVGTGQNIPQGKSGGSPFDKDFLAKVFGNNTPRTPGSLNSIPYDEAKQGTDRYPVFQPGADNEQLYGLNQNPVKQFANGVLKGLAGFGAGFVDGMMTIPDTISAIANGKVSELYNSDVENATAQWQKNLDQNVLPNYTTHQQDARGAFLNSLPFSGGFANFWGNTMIKGIGSMAGSIYSAVVQDAVLAAATGGLGDAITIPAQFSKAALALNKLMTGSEKVAETIAEATRLGRTSEQIIDLQKLQLLTQGKRLANKGQYLMNLYGTGRTMSAGAAADQYTALKDELTTQYINKNGYGPMGDELQKIEDTARGSANAKFAMDTGLMMVAENLSLDRILSPFGVARQKYLSGIGEKIGMDMENVGVAEGNAYVGAADGQPGKLMTGQVEYNAPKGIDKVWQIAKPYVSGFVSGGFIFGGGLTASEAATKSFYEDKYNGKIKGTIQDMLGAVGKGMEAEFGTAKGWENIWIGGMMGALLHQGTKMYQQWRSGTTPEGIRNGIIDATNKASVSGFMDVNYDSAAKTLGNAEKMKAANEKGDPFEYDNVKHGEFVNYSLTHIKNGMTDLGLRKLELMKELPPEKFTTMFGMEDTPENRDIANRYTDNLIDEYKNIAKSRSLLDTTFSNPFAKRDKPRGDEQEEQNEKHKLFEEWKDTLTHYSSISRNVAARVDEIKRGANDLYSVVSPETLTDFTNPKKLNTYNSGLKARITELQKGIDDKTTTDPAKDSKNITFLTKLTGQIDELNSRIIDEGLTNPDNAYKTFDDLKVFEKLLNYKLNGEDASFENIQEVPKEALAQLASYGRDLNRLDIYKKQASHVYDMLSSKEGWDKFYKEQKAQRANQPPPESQTQGAAAASKGGLGTGTEGTTEPTEGGLVVTHPTTKEQKTYKEGDTVYLYPKKGNAVGATINSVNDDGSVNVTHKDGTQAVVPASELFKPTGTPTTKTTVKTTQPPVSTNPPPVGTSTNTPEPPLGAPSTGDGDMDKKTDITIGIHSLKDPIYETPGTDDDNYHIRHMNFLYDMGQSDPNVFNQENAPNILIHPVTPNTAVAMGFDADWIQKTGGDANTIRGTYVIKKGNDYWYVDGKGNELTKVGDKANPSEVIYSSYRTAELIDNKGRKNYTNHYGVDEAEITKQWEAQRQFILSKKTPQELTPSKFTVSQGIYKTNPGKKNADGKYENITNSVVKVGLVNEEDLYKPIIYISTIADAKSMQTIIVNPANEVEATREGRSIKNGQQVLNHGLNVVFLNNEHLNADRANNVFDLLKYASDVNNEISEARRAKDYVNNIVYTASSKTAKITPASISIKDGSLFLGQNPKGIEFHPESLEDNKEKIINFLKTEAFHNILNSEITKISSKAKDPEALVYRELGIVDGKLEITKEWPTYNHYLLSDEGGRTPVLSTNIATPQEGRRPVIQKYATLKNWEYTPPPAPTAPARAEAPKPPSKPIGEEDAEVSKEGNEVIEITGKIVEFTPIKDESGNTIGASNIEGIGGKDIASRKKPKSQEAAKKLVEKALKPAEVKVEVAEAPTDDLGFLGNPDVVPPPDSTAALNVDKGSKGGSIQTKC